MKKDTPLRIDMITAAQLEFGDLKITDLCIDTGSPETDRAVLNDLQESFPTSSQKASRNNPQKDSLLLSEAIKQYIKDKMDNNHWGSEKTKNTNEHTLRLFITIVGDKPIKNISHEDMERYSNLIRKIPSNQSKKGSYKGKSISKLSEINIPDEDRMSPTTIRNHNRRTTSLFAWAIDKGKIEVDPSSAITNPKSEISNRRRPFTTDELTRLFNGYFYIGKKPKTGAIKWHYSSFWLPLLGLYTGARLEELAQLHVSDLQELDGYWCASINDDEEKCLKTTKSKRFIPIHSALRKFGFIDFVTDMKEAKMKRLFPELKKGKKSGYGASFTKRFKNYREACGVSYTRNEEKVLFHSFRHTFITRLAEKDVSAPHRSNLAGHSESDSTNSKDYTHGLSVKESHSNLEKLDYEVDMSHVSYAWYKQNRHKWYASTILLRKE